MRIMNKRKDKALAGGGRELSDLPTMGNDPSLRAPAIPEPGHGVASNLGKKEAMPMSEGSKLTA